MAIRGGLRGLHLRLVITQFQAISAYASVILRLGEFVESAEKSITDQNPA